MEVGDDWRVEGVRENGGLRVVVEEQGWGAHAWENARRAAGVGRELLDTVADATGGGRGEKVLHPRAPQTNIGRKPGYSFSHSWHALARRGCAVQGRAGFILDNAIAEVKAQAAKFYRWVEAGFINYGEAERGFTTLTPALIASPTRARRS